MKKVTIPAKMKQAGRVDFVLRPIEGWPNKLLRRSMENTYDPYDPLEHFDPHAQHGQPEARGGSSVGREKPWWWSYFSSLDLHKPLWLLKQRWREWGCSAHLALLPFPPTPGVFLHCSWQYLNVSSDNTKWIEAHFPLSSSLHKLTVFKWFALLKAVVPTRSQPSCCALLFLATLCTSAHGANDHSPYLLGSKYLQKHIPEPLMHFSTCLHINGHVIKTTFRKLFSVLSLCYFSILSPLY